MSGTYTPGAGTQLQMSISGSLTTLAQVQRITPPGVEVGTVEVTHLASEAKEFLATIEDGGEIQFALLWNPAASTHAAVWAAMKAKVAKAFKVIFNDLGAAAVTFDAIITKFPWDELDVESAATVPITCKVTGPVALDP